MRLLAYYWGQGRDRQNPGDYANKILIEANGHEIVPFTGSTKEFSTLHLGIGTYLRPKWLDNIAMHKTVWGGGADGVPGDFHRPDLHVTAVRGPRTAALTGFNNVAMGCPSALLPEVLPLVPRRHRPDSAYVPHIESEHLVTSVNWFNTGVREFIQVSHANNDDAFVQKVLDLISPHFLLSTSLHALAIRLAYASVLGMELPCALCVPEGFDLPSPFKHTDWSLYYGVKPVIVRNLQEGRDWWETYGQHGRIRELGPLRKACPFWTRS